MDLSIASFIQPLLTWESDVCIFRNFSEAEEILTRVLTKTEEHFGVSLLCCDFV